MGNDEKIKLLHEHCSDNELEILQSDKCSCFFCRQTYSARNVNDWATEDGKMTAICPECGMTSVIGDACGIPMDKTLLKEMNLQYFGENYMEKHPEAARAYITRYKEGKITKKPQNESLFLQYLYILLKEGDDDAAFDLGQIFEFGTEFTNQDVKAAFSYYAMIPFYRNGQILTRLGIISESGLLGNVDERGAFECYSKGMALGSLSSMMHFADCYRKGIFVEADPKYAFSIYERMWAECYSRFVFSNGRDLTVFPELAYRLGLCYLEGTGVEQDYYYALRSFLYAECGFSFMKPFGLMGEMADAYEDTVNQIKELAAYYGLEKNPVSLDNDSFADTYEDEDSLILFYSRNTIEKATFIEAENELYLSVSYSIAPLILDCGNLFCGFMDKKIEWHFVDVASFQMKPNRIFNAIEGNGNDGYSFTYQDGNDEQEVASMNLFPPKKKEKEPLKKVKKAVGA